MESLSDTVWDVVLSGTGLPQSLLALALSRSGKKVLHIDKNDYYGGAEAALSLQEVESWADTAGEGSPFRYATLRNMAEEIKPELEEKSSARLGFSRAYSLSLSPQLIYTRSNLLPALVSSKVYRQLEFLAVGSWWIYEDEKVREDAQNTESGGLEAAFSTVSLKRIPGGREDIFADKSIDLRSTRSLMKFLKLAADTEAHASILEVWGSKPFPDFLESHLGIASRLQAPLLALTMSPNPPTKTLTFYALPRIQRHLTSVGMFGPGFGSVIPKWGGLAEIAQVACRAGAVGGGVYVLQKGFETDENPDQQTLGREGTRLDEATQVSTVRLEGGDEIKTRWIVGSDWDMPSQFETATGEEPVSDCVSRSITIVSSPLSQLFPPPAEGAPPPAGAVVVFPTGTLELEYGSDKPQILKADPPPVYLMIHSSDTGECPAGQCVIYAHTAHPISYTVAHSLLQRAIDKFVASIDETPKPQILWYLHYDQKRNSPATADDYDANIRCAKLSNPHVLKLPDMDPGLALEDDLLKHVRAAWRRIVDEDEVFMAFGERDGTEEEGFEDGEGEM
ncbi:MAG: Rab proteins geranylgeranyltransferase component A [Alectoria fallacina]|uniref:Rab proteins geranylgeranyltransferase n=1 Tax=Alectoria fallacina TaxID=1903189 RepID=A0A8H3J773_9LECA|nr:MAG: Rab proteins geranylgeranyltransferase component A [Alectoria fallacina]